MAYLHTTMPCTHALSHDNEMMENERGWYTKVSKIYQLQCLPQFGS